MRYWYAVIFIFISLNLPSQEYRSEIIRSAFDFEIKGNKLSLYRQLVIQVNNRMGDRDAVIRIPYAKGDKVSIEEAYLQDIKGNIIRKIHKNEIKDQSYISDISLYEDDFIKWADIKHNSYPYQLVYSYKIETKGFNSIIALDYTNYTLPVKECEINILTTSENVIKYKQDNLPEPVIEENLNNKKYKWNFSYNGSEGEENNSFFFNAPRIKVVPLNFSYGVKGSMENWTTFGNWHFKLNRGKDVLPDAEKKKINELVSHIEDEKEKARVLYEYMQEYTRYVNVRLDIGGFSSYPAEYVCKNRYGDCKALTNYMQAILKYAGIESFYTLIYSGSNVKEIEPDFPSNCFNHAILTIPFPKDTIYVECTSKSLPFGYVHTSIQGRQALVIRENNSFFTTLPILTPENVKTERIVYINKSLGKTVPIEMKTRQRGIDYENASFQISRGKNSIEKYIKENLLFGGNELIEYGYHKFDDYSIGFDLEYRLSNFYKEYDKTVILNPFSIELMTYENPEKRRTYLQIDLPEYYTDSLIYDFGDKVISKIPENVSLNTQFGHYHVKFTVSDNKLIIDKSLLILRGKYNLDEYKDFFDFISSIKNIENKNIYIEVL